MPSARRSVTRREFIATTAATVAATSVANMSSALAKDISDIRVAVIGINGRGRGHVDGLANNVVALCDVDESVLQRVASKFQKDRGRQVDTFVDYRELLQRKDIDAVSIATPNHTHALLAIEAAKAGKDVYVEKPVAHNVWEGRQMVAAAKKYGRVMQCGTQSRSSPDLKAAVEFVQGGGLGKIQYALGTCYKPRPSIGKLEAPLEIPSSINYDLWCGPAEARDLYRPKLHYDWHWDTNTGNGDMGNQGIHQMDIARWFLGEQTLAPRAISIGGRLGYDDAGDTPNTQVVYHAYEAAPLIFETRGLPRSKAGQAQWRRSMDRYRGSGVGVIVQCEGGHVFAPSYSEAIAYDRSGKEIKRWRGGGNPHYENWLQAVAAQDPSQLNAPILEGHLSSSLCYVGGISHLLGEKQQAGEIAQSIAANERLANSFHRMAGHLRANDVDIDSSAELTLGPWLELDTASERFTSDAANKLRERAQQRADHAVPDLAGNSALAQS